MPQGQLPRYDSVTQMRFHRDLWNFNTLPRCLASISLGGAARIQNGTWHASTKERRLQWGLCVPQALAQRYLHQMTLGSSILPAWQAIFCGIQTVRQISYERFISSRRFKPHVVRNNKKKCIPSGLYFDRNEPTNPVPQQTPVIIAALTYWAILRQIYMHWDWQHISDEYNPISTWPGNSPPDALSVYCIKW